MRKEVSIDEEGKKVVSRRHYIPARYILAGLLIVFEIILIIGIMVALTIFVPYFWIFALFVDVVVIIRIISSNDNPDYKLPWLFFVLVLPVIGFMLYFLFYERRLSKKDIAKYANLSKKFKDDYQNEDIKKEPAYSYLNQICKISNSHIFKETTAQYFPSGESSYKQIINDLKKAKKFIFIEFFIIEEGIFWNSVLDVLREKVDEGLEIKVLYDDIGCMQTLPGDYYKRLQAIGIESVPFSRLKGQATGEFNNRSHRKLLIIDSKVAYTGGINLADEYINKKNKFGHWKDCVVRIRGRAVVDYTKLFIADYFLNVKDFPFEDLSKYMIDYAAKTDGYVLAFGDAPKPIYEYNVGKTVIMTILQHAKKYVYITTPYLIVDSEITNAIINAVLRDVDVRIIVPHIPDKRLVYWVTQSSCQNLKDHGVKIYEYTPGFIHAKMYIADDDLAMVGTINLDYRSLVHHYENGIVLYKNSAINDMKEDFFNTLSYSKRITASEKINLFKRIFVSIISVFSPLL